VNISQLQVPLSELKNRISRFRCRMDETNPGWKVSVIFSKVNIFYFTGTMPDGMLFIFAHDEAILFVRRSFERALDESLFPNIKPMDGYRDAAETLGNLPDTVYLETEIVSLAMLQRFQKYFPFSDIKSLDAQVGWTRSIKSPYELSIMKRAGKIHRKVLEDKVPLLLREGISETEFANELFSILMAEGHQGLVRFGMFGTEMFLGHVAFGDSSIYATNFNGPGGNRGLSPAVPFPGSPLQKLRKGDLVFVDVGCGVEGYHTDKTMTYMFGAPLPDMAIEAHQQCVAIQNKMAEMLKPGAVPSEIYHAIMDNLHPDFLENFMGFGPRHVKFLGHGIGLTIDESPVIAHGFNEPIQEGMVFALEPKKGIERVGMVGIENTFIVTPLGGQCITGINPGLIPIY
jgi:Xaa-Pro dipeptidase